jgi:hypothetical protein
MKKVMFLLILFLGVFAVSCGKDGDCENKVLEVKSLEAVYGCENTKYNMNVDLSNNFIIVRSQLQFQNYVTGTCIPDIDFNAYDLIIGKQALTSGNSLISYELTEDCKTSDMLLKVIFSQNETAEAPNLTYHALVSKLGNDQIVNVEVEIKY